MFSDCTSLTTVPLFDTSKVTDMRTMFGECNKLTSLDLSSFDTSNVTSMVGMFSYCNGLTSLDSHMTRYTEWTAMSYLTNSIYGRCSDSETCTEITINDNSSYISGEGDYKTNVNLSLSLILTVLIPCI